MKNGNLSTQLRQKKYQIRALQTDLCNIRVEASTQTTKVKGNRKVEQSYAYEEKQKPQCPTDPIENKYSKKLMVVWL